MRILFVTQYGQLAASSRTRVFQYLPYLNARGVETDVLTILPDEAIAASQIEVLRHPLRKLRYYLWAAWRTAGGSLCAWWRARRVDVLFIQKVVFPTPVRWLLHWRRPLVVYDFDDAIYTTELQTQDNWLAALKSWRNARGLPAMLGLADRAVVENDYTGQFASAYCPTFTITGPVDTDAYRFPPTRVDDDETVVLGWIGSATTSRYLTLIKEPLCRLGRRFPNLRLEVVGAAAPEMNGLSVRSKVWQLEREGEDLGGFDIGLMPIADDAWTRGKGGYKLLQYMASGLPVVASPVGVNAQSVADGESGFLANDDDEWEEHLAHLVSDGSLRRQMGRRGRAAVEARFALSLHQERLHDMLVALVYRPKKLP